MICSDEFEPLGRAESQTLGMPGIPIATLPHPLAGNKPATVREKAHNLIEEVVRLLTESSEALDREYRQEQVGPETSKVRSEIA